MDNIGYIRLSDGRDVCVEADHNGEVRITLINHDQRPAQCGSNYGVMVHQMVHRTTWNRELLQGKHTWQPRKNVDDDDQHGH